ncbi:MAG TPA: hypothetical protein VMG35_17445 [Bryobacteraceae bacterium]|nr:hypothetical protein [Bryobacteraceae bacterium]
MRARHIPPGVPHLPLLPAWREGFFLLLCAALLAWQLLLPGFIGMANNGDFPKVAGPLCLEGVDHETEKFAYFQPDYERGPSSCYDPHIPSSEIVPAWVASSLERALGDETHFDIRWLGGLHALIFTGIYYLLLLVLRPLRPAARIVLSLAALWIFADVGFVAYLNTFYSDVPAMLGGLATICLAVLLARGEKISPVLLGLFGLSALFFVTSKAQHGIYGVIPIAAAVWFGWRSHELRGRLVAGLVTSALAAGMIWVICKTPAWYTAQSRFNLIFAKIAYTSTTPVEDLQELGLDPSDARYVGMHAFMPGNPLENDEAFRRRFYARATYWKAIRFYVRHPGRVVRILQSDLRLQAPVRRLYANFPKSYGLPGGTQAQRFSSWSFLRTQLFVLWPEHVVVWYALWMIGAPFLAIREKSRFRSALLWTAWAVSLAGAGEFCVASLADGAETARHLWMFQVFTDVTFFLALVFAASTFGPDPRQTAC